MNTPANILRNFKNFSPNTDFFPLRLHQHSSSLGRKFNTEGYFSSSGNQSIILALGCLITATVRHLLTQQSPSYFITLLPFSISSLLPISLRLFPFSYLMMACTHAEVKSNFQPKYDFDWIPHFSSICIFFAERPLCLHFQRVPDINPFDSFVSHLTILFKEIVLLPIIGKY
jgi:hypothetical protein